MLARTKDAKGNDNGSVLDHLQMVEKMQGEKPKELDFNDPDPTINYILNHFLAIKQAVTGRISFSELESYSRMMSLTFLAVEIEAIMTIDRIFEAKAND